GREGDGFADIRRIGARSEHRRGSDLVDCLVEGGRRRRNVVGITAVGCTYRTLPDRKRAGGECRLSAAVHRDGGFRSAVYGEGDIAARRAAAGNRRHGGGEGDRGPDI